jgi:exodeoxyribonuclease V gamma subunit
VGQNVQDNSHIPPSVLVSELLDYMDGGFQTVHERPRDKLLTDQKLQPFNPEYFKASTTFMSYSEENFEVARKTLQKRKEPEPFVMQPLSEPGEEWKKVDLDDLVRFFSNPCQFLLNKRLGLYLDNRVAILEESESFELAGLDRYALDQRLVERRLSGGDLEGLFLPVKASGRLPHGTIGRCLYGQISRDIERFSQKTEPFLAEPGPEPMELDLTISGFNLTGRIHGKYSERLIQYRFARAKPKDWLRAWIYHLALNASDYPRTSLFIGLQKKGRKREWAAWSYTPPDNSHKILRNLLDKYWEGLRKPLHFFPESSWIYASGLMKSTPEDALDRARRIWNGNDRGWNECEDPYFHLCFKHGDPLDDAFRKLSEEVWGPLIEHQKVLK